jgi:hypothetical protein
MTERSTATVFLTNLSDHDYTPIAQYGAMRPITSGNYAFFKTTRLLEEVVQALASSEETDYLAFSGSAFVGALCLTVWLIMHKECKALLFDPRQNAYIPRVLKRSDIIIQIEKLRELERRER